MMIKSRQGPARVGEKSPPTDSLPIVHVVDDDDAMRKMTALLIESVGLNVTVHPSAEAFLEAYEPDRTGCLVLDVRMPGMSGLALQRELAAQRIRIPIIIITGHGDVPMAVETMRMGAVDFIEKPFREEQLLERIHQAIAQDAVDRRKHAKRADVLTRLALLTQREREVLDRVVVGRANKQIAAELGVGRKAIEAHRSRVMKKMQVHSGPELVHLIYNSGALPVDTPRR